MLLGCGCGGLMELAFVVFVSGAIGNTWVWLQQLVRPSGRK
jgi:hypothetical protein